MGVSVRSNLIERRVPPTRFWVKYRRMEPRYRRLRTHGLNERGESIKGQPDSYVGEAARCCTIAFCYTTQKRSWWKKVVKDVQDATAVSRVLEEVVAIIPHNSDRDGPMDPTIDWLSEAHQAAGQASFRIIDGRDIAVLLDKDHQDLRHEHLGIPYAHLSGPCLLASARATTGSCLDRIKGTGRYDAERYIPRSADRELYGLWQRGLRNGGDGERRTGPVRMIALVSDSGVGKTSLVCRFAESLAKVLPVVLLQARDLALETEDALVARAVQSLEGVLDATVRVREEAAIVRHLPGTMPLTVIVDGLDEAHNPAAVRKSITCWLQSQLGQSSVLIVTSRPEFWRTCSEQSWRQWMPNVPPDDRVPKGIDERLAVERSIERDAIHLPERFSEKELEAAWGKGGRGPSELYVLPKQVRDELRHPFTLRAFLDLCAQDGSLPPVTTRADRIERWLNRRLDAEVERTERTALTQFQLALRIVATKVADSPRGSVSVDDLCGCGVPRFDSVHPPGPVVERLVQANVLETVPGHADRIRFAVEAVQDFCRAEAEVDAIREDPVAVAHRFSELRFTDACPRLSRIGRRLANEDVRHVFVARLAEFDARMATVVIGIAPPQYTPEVRACVAEALGRDIAARHRVRGSIAISMLADLNCSEAAEVLGRNLLPPADPHTYLKQDGATAFIKLGHASAVSFVYRWMRLMPRGTDTYYFREDLALFRHATCGFRWALGNVAASQLMSPSGTEEHARAVCMLAYLGDPRLASHLRDRMAQNGRLLDYENHALVALGSEEAALAL
jgi:hypothetical protein